MSTEVNCSNYEVISYNLNEREIQVLFLIAQGCTNTQAGAIIYISSDTVKSVLKQAVKKLGVENRTQAVYLATRNGIFNQHISLFDNFINKL